MNNSDLPNNNIIMQNSDWIERFPFLEFNGTMSEDEVLNLVKMRKAIKMHKSSTRIKFTILIKAAGLLT